MPINSPLSEVDAIALDRAVDTVREAVRDGVMMVAVTTIEPAAIARVMAPASTPVASARLAM